MALGEYVGYGLLISMGYIGIKYGPQIIKNLQANQANPPSQAPQQGTPSAPSSTTPSSQGDNLDNLGPIPYGPQHQNDTTGGRGPPPIPTHIIRPHQGQGPLAPQTTETNPFYPAHNTVIPTPGQTVPSNSEHPGRKPPHIRHHQHIVDPGFIPDKSVLGGDDTAGCICTSAGVYKAYPGQICNLAGTPCTPKAYLGFFDGYEMAVEGPQWRQTIPYREVVANQGKMSNIPSYSDLYARRSPPAGRFRKVGRALAAGNHQFMPGGFLLSEASVRRGVDNVYAAGT